MKTVVMVVLLLFIGGMAFILTQIYLNNQPNYNDKYYSGKLYIETKQEDFAFRESIARPEVNILEYEVMNKDYPAIVTFKVVAPYNVDFEYGDEYQTSNNNLFGFVIGGILIAGSTTVLVLRDVITLAI